MAKIEDDKKDKKRPDDHDRDRVDYLDDSTEVSSRRFLRQDLFN